MQINHVSYGKISEHKRRFYDAISHRVPDRVPINYLATQRTDESLRNYLKIDGESELLDALGCDFYFLSVRDISQNESSDTIRADGKPPHPPDTRVCPFGITYRRSVGTWKFSADEVIGHPLESAQSEKEILAHPMPDVGIFNFDSLIAECERNSNRVTIGGFWSAVFGNAYRLMGYENFLLNMALRPVLTKTLVHRLTDFYLELNDRLFTTLNGKLDIYFIGNDFGTQNGPMFRREMWLEHFMTPYSRLVSLAKSHRVFTMAHSCGSIANILPDLIEAGIDIIDPVQTTAEDMDPQSLKERFGDRLTFHGAIDTQHVLPSYTVDEVKRHVAEQISVLGFDGGYILAPCNNIQSDTPPKNIVAMYEAASSMLI